MDYVTWRGKGWFRAEEHDLTYIFETSWRLLDGEETVGAEGPSGEAGHHQGRVLPARHRSSYIWKAADRPC